jgi:hypothetical protein
VQLILGAGAYLRRSLLSFDLSHCFFKVCASLTVDDADRMVDIQNSYYNAHVSMIFFQFSVHAVRFCRTLYAGVFIVARQLRHCAQAL